MLSLRARPDMVDPMTSSAAEPIDTDAATPHSSVDLVITESTISTFESQSCSAVTSRSQDTRVGGKPLVDTRI
jgi:hypothetical protein